MFQKSPKRQPSLERPKSTLTQKAFYCNQYALLVQTLQKILAQKKAPKVPEWPSYGNLSKVTQNPLILKRAKGGPREIFQKSPKKQPLFERPKSTLAQMAISSNQYALKVQRLENILAQTAALKVPEQPSYGNFCKVTQNPHFLKKCKGGTKRSFTKEGAGHEPLEVDVHLKAPQTRL